MAIIRSKEEEELYIQAMINKGFERAWIGMHDIFAGTNYITVLDEDIGQVGYAHWAIVSGFQQPDNGAIEEAPQDCISLVTMGKYANGMDDYNCWLQAAYICKW